jgi:hypothetical protein
MGQKSRQFLCRMVVVVRGGILLALVSYLYSKPLIPSLSASGLARSGWRPPPHFFWVDVLLNDRTGHLFHSYSLFFLKKQQIKQTHFTLLSVADPGCLSRIRIFPSRIQGQKIPDLVSGSASKNLSIFNPKNCFQALGNDPGCSSWIRIPDPGVKKAVDPGSATLICLPCNHRKFDVLVIYLTGLLSQVSLLVLGSRIRIQISMDPQ